MKNRSFRVRPIAALRHQPWRPGACSLMVLAGLGVLSFALPHEAHAQRVVPPNTLPVLRGVVSDRNGISINRSAPAASRAQLTIDQATLRGIIGWDSFDVGSNAEVLFRHQMGTAASTLNRIYDARPSVIQGRVRSEGATPGSAGGQILLINQNGIVFGPGAQVNTQSLIASTLNITNQRFMSGALAGSTAAFEGSYDNEGNTLAARPSGSVVLTAGRDGLAAPVLQAGQGGSIMIFAPTIDNQGGVIRAPDGQVILAAGSKAYLGINPNESDTTLRGYVVEVEAPAEGPSLNITSLIRNAGEISADRGNVTLAALAVNQEGRISAKTALQANGSIYLKAGATERVRDENGVVTQTLHRAGTVVLGRGSVTEVTPDADDRSTVPDSQAYAPNASSPTDFRGVIEVSGRSIEHHGALRAQGGVIKLDAKASDAAGPVRVYLAEGSETSVAGTWADVDFSKNIATFRVTSNELKNSPDQKTGVLRGAEVTVDLREGNNILDLAGYRGLVARTVNEKAAVGGDLFISSAGSVVQRQGATLDASGGGYRYTGGMVGTTRLLGADGKVYDIATAPQALRYTQLLDNYQSTDARWGQTTSHSNPLGLVRTYQPGYTEGKAGGLVQISAQSGLVLDGTLKGGVTVGARQAANAPKGATLRIGDYSSSHRVINEQSQIGSITLTQQASDTLGAAFNASTALSEAQRSGFSLGAEQIFGSATQTDKGREETGFGTVELNSSGRIVVAEGVNLRADPGAALTLRAQEIDIAGDLRLAGGSLTLHAAAAASPIPGLGSTGGITVRSGATLSTAGEWVNASTADNRAAPVVPTGRGAAHSALNGGSLTLQLNDPLYQTQLERGSVLDVSGGASLSASQRVTAGEGGKLTLANGADGQVNPDWMQAELRGFGLAKGGELTLKVGEALIVPQGTTGTVPAATTRLGSGLFSDLGFANVGVEAAGGITIAPGTQVDASQRNLVLDTAVARRLASGGRHRKRRHGADAARRTACADERVARRPRRKPGRQQRPAGHGGRRVDHHRSEGRDLAHRAPRPAGRRPAQRRWRQHQPDGERPRYTRPARHRPASHRRERRHLDARHLRAHTQRARPGARHAARRRLDHAAGAPYRRAGGCRRTPRRERREPGGRRAGHRPDARDHAADDRRPRRHARREVARRHHARRHPAWPRRVQRRGRWQLRAGADAARQAVHAAGRPPHRGHSRKWPGVARRRRDGGCACRRACAHRRWLRQAAPAVGEPHRVPAVGRPRFLARRAPRCAAARHRRWRPRGRHRGHRLARPVDGPAHPGDDRQHRPVQLGALRCVARPHATQWHRRAACARRQREPLRRPHPQRRAARAHRERQRRAARGPRGALLQHHGRAGRHPPDRQPHHYRRPRTAGEPGGSGHPHRIHHRRQRHSRCARAPGPPHRQRQRPHPRRGVFGRRPAHAGGPAHPPGWHGEGAARPDHDERRPLAHARRGQHDLGFGQRPDHALWRHRFRHAVALQRWGRRQAHHHADRAGQDHDAQRAHARRAGRRHGRPARRWRRACRRVRRRQRR
ncbi:filamentous hemagglutinin N-terminal domain-containing protein [Rhizobacter sp. J219]|uniref:two-partner secretion domain-containing protein n=1 Tax=Rhizobacter sp. J219 TaxID=2898430 RepID=UPI002151D20A|nr:filamentous hemagglutinin N-terminal domain-containing protein [Rhizobacter sp. J219]MCR5881889.1 filamentous hemagglutinin N-terminal domain-containing protein [Rhizobacter sp. J219]